MQDVISCHAQYFVKRKNVWHPNRKGIWHQLKSCGRTADNPESPDLWKLMDEIYELSKSRPPISRYEFIQIRFPRSKKKRIQRKWRQRFHNWAMIGVP